MVPDGAPCLMCRAVHRCSPETRIAGLGYESVDDHALCQPTAVVQQCTQLQVRSVRQKILQVMYAALARINTRAASSVDARCSSVAQRGRA